jgi:hypothetical protein
LAGTGLPLKKGRAGNMTHDYKRHGTTTLFAALDVATGQVIGECLPRHRAKEFLKFLRRIDKETLPCLDLHLILDNYATQDACRATLAQTSSALQTSRPHWCSISKWRVGRRSLVMSPFGV